MKRNRLICVLLILIGLTTQFVSADDWYGSEPGYYKVYDSETNEILFQTAREISKDDQYLSNDNKMYKITTVNKNDTSAQAEFVEDISLPEINKEALENIKRALGGKVSLNSILNQTEQEEAEGERKVGIYATHSAESYVPSDGAESLDEGGGILKVGEKLKEGFENNSVNSIFDNTLHNPHDAGAYKRSRRTATQLIREHQPTSLIDVHRDAIPVEEYLAEIEGNPASQVRLVVGRRNQNFAANEETALKIKSIADEMYPGLIKDIFYGKGDYNQDLTPRAILLEMGTHEMERERPETSAGYMAEVITTALFGQTFTEEEEENGAGGAAGTEGGEGTANGGGGGTPNEAATESNTGAGSGILAILAVVVIGGLGFMFLSNGGHEWKSKMSRFKEEFANFLGRDKTKK